jgi:hypothetical protein
MERTLEQVNLHGELVAETLQKRGVKLNSLQQSKFETACWKAIDENEVLTFREYLIATNTYLSFILEFPQLSL